MHDRFLVEFQDSKVGVEIFPFNLNPFWPNPNCLVCNWTAWPDPSLVTCNPPFRTGWSTATWRSCGPSTSTPLTTSRRRCFRSSSLSTVLSYTVCLHKSFILNSLNFLSEMFPLFITKSMWIFPPINLPEKCFFRLTSLNLTRFVFRIRTLPVRDDAGDGHPLELRAAEAAEREDPHNGHRAQDVHQGRIMEYSEHHLYS